MNIPTFLDVLIAHERIKPCIHRTPVFTSSFVNEFAGAELFFKCEKFQKAGAFKARGALNAVSGLGDAQAAKGVANRWRHSLLVTRGAMKRNQNSIYPKRILERVMGIEPTTYSLGSCRSTTELHPHIASLI